MRVSRLIVPVVAALAAATMAGPPASAVAPTAVPAAVAAVPAVGFQSSAFGTYVSALDKTIQSGATSTASISCTTVMGLTRTNSLATVTLPVVGRTGTVTTKVTTSGSGTTAVTTSTSTVQGVNLLGGAVVADAITTVANARSDAGIQSATGSTNLAGLKILGRSFALNVPPNTSVPLDVGGKRVGTVTLNLQAKSNLNGIYALSTRGIAISLLAGNPFGLPASTVVYIGGSNAAVTTPRAAISGGSGWGLSATTLSGAVSVGRQPHIGVPCFGGTQTGSIATLDRAGLLTTGTTQVTSSASGNLTTATSKVVTSVAAPRILAGLISADAIVAEAQADRTTTGSIVLTDRSRFVNLKIAGLPAITSAVAPNTKVEVPGLGSVTLHKVTRTAKGIEVVMLEIKLSQLLGGLPTGTVVQVSGANANIIG